MKCALCTSRGEVHDEPTVGALLTHYKTAHPGESSPKRKRAAGSAGPGLAPPPAAPADPPVIDDDPDAPSNEVRPEIPAGMEISPAAPPRGWRDWFGLPPKRPKAIDGKERRPERFKHESTAEILGAGWGGLGWLFIRSGLDEPVGRTFQMQQAVAGDVLERLTAGTIIDRAVLQPIARNTDNAEAAAALFALPALVFAYRRVPDEARPMVETLMQEAALAHLKSMMPVLKKKRARDRELAKVVEELKAEGLLPDEIATASDAVDAMLNALFAGAPVGEPEAEPDPANNGAGQRVEVEL